MTQRLKGTKIHHRWYLASEAPAPQGRARIFYRSWYETDDEWVGYFSVKRALNALDRVAQGKESWVPWKALEWDDPNRAAYPNDRESIQLIPGLRGKVEVYMPCGESFDISIKTMQRLLRRLLPA